MNKRLILSVASAALVAAALTSQAGSAASNDWASFRHDAARTGYNPDEVVIKPGTAGRILQRWNSYTSNYTTSTGSGPPTQTSSSTYVGTLSSPAVIGNRVYVGSGDKSVISYDLQSGHTRWRYSEPTLHSVDSTPAVGSSGLIYFGDTGNTVYALREVVVNGVITPQKAWSTPPLGPPNAPIISSPLVVNNVVYVGSSDGGVYALDANLGTLLWKFATGGPVDSSPAYDNGLLFVTSYDNNLYALDTANSGRQVWKTSLGASNVATPAVSGGQVYVGSRGGLMYSVNASTGVITWQQNLNAPIESSAGLWPSAPGGGLAYVATTVPNDTFYALSMADGHVVWTFTSPLTVQVSTINSPVHSSPAVGGGMVFFGSFDGYLYGLDAVSGLSLVHYNTSPNQSSSGSNQTPLFIDSSPSISDGNILISTHNSSLGLVDLAAPAQTQLSYTGRTTLECGDRTVVSARLVNADTGLGIEGQSVHFQMQNMQVPVTTLTDASGNASAIVPVPPTSSGSQILTISYDGAPPAYDPAVTLSQSLALTQDALDPNHPITYTGVVHGGAGRPIPVSATLYDSDNQAPVNQTVNFTIGSQTVSAVTDQSGVASTSIVLNQPVGPYTVQASYPGGCWSPASSSQPFSLELNPTRLTNTGSTSADYNDTLPLSAQLVFGDTGKPISGRTVSWTIGSQSASAVTDSSGNAATSLVLSQPAGQYTATVAFAGDSADAAASAGITIAITREDTAIVYGGPNRFAYGTPSQVVATVTDAITHEAIPAGMTVIFRVADDNGNYTGDQATGLTDANGVATATMVLNSAATVPGSNNLRMVSGFAGDQNFAESSFNYNIAAVSMGQPSLVYTGALSGSNNPSVSTTFSATLTGPAGQPIEGRNVAFVVKPANSSQAPQVFGPVLTDQNGVATVTTSSSNPINQPAGSNYTVQAQFAGDRYWHAASTSNPFTVVGAPLRTDLGCVPTSPNADPLNLFAEVGQPFKYSATLKKRGGSPLSGQPLTMTIANGSQVAYSSTALTDAAGNVVFSLTPDPVTFPDTSNPYSVQVSYPGVPGAYLSTACTQPIYIVTWQYNFVDQLSQGRLRVRINMTARVFLYEDCKVPFASSHAACVDANGASYYTSTPIFRAASSTEMTYLPAPADHMVAINYQHPDFTMAGTFDEASHSFAAAVKGGGPVTLRASCTDGPINNNSYCSN